MTVGTKWYVGRCAIGVGVAMGVNLLALMLCAYLTECGVVGEGRTDLCIWLCAWISSFAGAIIGGGKTVKHGTMTLCCGMMFYLTIVLIGFFAGGTFVTTAAFHRFIPIALGTLMALASFHGKNSEKKRGKRVRHKRR